MHSPIFAPQFPRPKIGGLYRVLGVLRPQDEYALGRLLVIQEIAPAPIRPGYWAIRGRDFFKHKYFDLFGGALVKLEKRRVCQCSRLPFPHKRTASCLGHET
jgi:hypothetical protein